MKSLPLPKNQSEINMMIKRSQYIYAVLFFCDFIFICGGFVIFNNLNDFIYQFLTLTFLCYFMWFNLYVLNKFDIDQYKNILQEHCKDILELSSKNEDINNYKNIVLEQGRQFKMYELELLKKWFDSADDRESCKKLYLLSQQQ